MTDTTAEPQALPVAGRVVGWDLGLSGQRNGEGYAVLEIDMGPIQASVKMTSREARRFAIETLCDQGPYLGYQPPNEGMRERSDGPPFTMNMTRREPRWRQRQSFEIAEERLRELIDQFGVEALGWALQRVEERP